MKFKQFLRESETHAVVEVREVTPDERRLAQDAQRLSAVIHSAVKLGAKTDLNKFLKDLKSFNDFNFLSTTIETVEQALHKQIKMAAAGKVVADNIQKIKHHRSSLHQALLSSDMKTAAIHKQELDAILDQTDHFIDAPNVVARHVNNTYTEKPSIFGSMALLTYLGSDEYEKIEKLNLDGPLYTSINFPKLVGQHSWGFWHYVVYFMLQLKYTADPVAIEGAEDFRTHMKVKYGGDDNFEKLDKVLSAYLHDNVKSLIPQIIDLVEQIPEIKAANDKRKSQIKRVYRGVGFGDDDTPSEEEIEAQDKKSRYVATSESRFAAKNFALQKGHLDAERRSAVGYIIEYAVTEEAVVLDTKVVQTVFGESEVIIDATKATITEITEV